MSWFEVIAKRMELPAMAYIDYIMQKHVREPKNLNQILDLMFSKIEEYENEFRLVYEKRWKEQESSNYHVVLDYSDIFKPSKELEYRIQNQSERMGNHFTMPQSVAKRQFPSRKQLGAYLSKNYSSGDKDTLTGELKYWSA
tara:strand:- start:79 stop:501 length:423 start_codon:yes stop_codon:yes gene_type:complete